jgi:hypothetical protein
MTHHEIIPRAAMVKRIRPLAHMAVKRQDRARIPELPPEIMSIADQQKIGSFAAVTILREFEKLEHGDIEPVPASFMSQSHATVDDLGS